MSHIRHKAYFVAGLIHFGLFASIYALWKAQPTEAPQVWWWACTGVAFMYGGMMTGVMFVYWPLRPWIHRARHLMNWRHWIIDELPTILALVPVAVGIAHVLKAAWKELKGYREKDQLNLETLSGLLKKVATQTEDTIHGKAPAKVHSISQQRARRKPARPKSQKRKAA